MTVKNQWQLLDFETDAHAYWIRLGLTCLLTFTPQSSLILDSTKHEQTVIHWKLDGHH